MSEDLELTLRTIYNRISPEIQIAGLCTRVNIANADFDFGEVTGIEMRNDEERFFAELSLDNDYEDEKHDINNYLWHYSDHHTGWGWESELDCNASAEELTAFVQEMLSRDTYWQKINSRTDSPKTL
jgi:hypothetical protein